MQVAAKLRYARISPQKCRLVADAVRGQSVSRALLTLDFMPKKSAQIMKKVLESAIANAEHNHGADIDELKVSAVMVDEAPTFATFRASAPRVAVHGLSSATATSRCRLRTSKERTGMGQKVNPIGIRLGITKDWSVEVVCGQRQLCLPGRV